MANVLQIGWADLFCRGRDVVNIEGEGARTWETLAISGGPAVERTRIRVGVLYLRSVLRAKPILQLGACGSHARYKPQQAIMRNCSSQVDISAG